MKEASEDKKDILINEEEISKLRARVKRLEKAARIERQRRRNKEYARNNEKGDFFR